MLVSGRVIVRKMTGILGSWKIRRRLSWMTFWLALGNSIGVIFVGVWILEIPVDKKMMEDFPRSIDAACVYRPTKEKCTRSFVFGFLRNFLTYRPPVDGRKSQTTTWDVWNSVKNGRFPISTGAGFLPSAVWSVHPWCCLDDSDTDFNQTLNASLPKNNCKLYNSFWPIRTIYNSTEINLKKPQNKCEDTGHHWNTLHNAPNKGHESIH